MRIIRRLISVLLVMVMLCSGALAATYRARVFSSSMKVYFTPSRSSSVVDRLDRGDRFYVKKISGNWAQISYGRNTGYARMSDIIFDKKIKAEVRRSTSFVFYTKASLKKNVSYRARLAKGTRVYVVGMGDGKLLITNASGNAWGVVSESAVRKC